MLRPDRKQERHGISTIRSGTLLKTPIPLRPFNDWNETKPGFVEADLVAHCGTQRDGSFLSTLTLTDIAIGWTECLPLLNRDQKTKRSPDWRTRDDPFEGIWEEGTGWREAWPEGRSAEMFRDLPLLRPERWHETQARTLRRGVQTLRARLLGTFADGWGDEAGNGPPPIPAFRAESVAEAS